MTDTPGGSPSRRRRRRRAASRQAPPPAAAAADRPAQREPAAPVTEPTPKPRRAQRPARVPHDAGERGLHDLIGGGHSQLGVSGSLRGRDVNRPTEQDLAEAERDVEIIRRHWRPAP